MTSPGKISDKVLLCGLRVLQENVYSKGAEDASPLPTTGEPLTDDDKAAAIQCIERIALKLVRQLVHQDRDMELVVPKDVQWGDPALVSPLTPGQTRDETAKDITGPAHTAVARVRFDAAPSRRKFAVIAMLLSHVHTLLSTRSTGTRRQLYYGAVDFLRTQREVDDGAQAVGRMLGLPPWRLGLLATAKGLVAGDLTLTTSDGEVLDCRSKPGGVLIPGDVSAIESLQSAARFVLVLEKDTIFQRVLREGILDRLGPCVIVTGKGYPDVSTRVLLRRLEAELKVPLLAVVDADPHGAHIMCVYRFGSKACPLPLRSLRWLGVLPSELGSLGVRSVPLTDKDASLARRLLARPDLPDAVRAEVSMFESLGTKGEVDALIEFSPCYITDVYLPNKIAAAHAL